MAGVGQTIQVIRPECLRVSSVRQARPIVECLKDAGPTTQVTNGQ